MTASTLSLIADVGGTNTRVALAQSARILPDTIGKFQNIDHPSLQALLGQFLQDTGHSVCDKAAVAIAGPVRDGKGSLTNLAWTIDAPSLTQVTGAKQTLVIKSRNLQH